RPAVEQAAALEIEATIEQCALGRLRPERIEATQVACDAQLAQSRCQRADRLAPPTVAGGKGQVQHLHGRIRSGAGNRCGRGPGLGKRALATERDPPADTGRRRPTIVGPWGFRPGLTTAHIDLTTSPAHRRWTPTGLRPDRDTQR